MKIVISEPITVEARGIRYSFPEGTKDVSNHIAMHAMSQHPDKVEIKVPKPRIEYEVDKKTVKNKKTKSNKSKK